MTDNETISKALGWTVDANGYWTSPIRSVFDAWKSKTPPQYTSDHNLIHSAEDALTEGEWVDYLYALAVIVRDTGAISVQGIRHATAAQCARAMAKVLGQRDPK